MKYLLDASALLPLVIRRGKRLIVEASKENLATTDLALYEACNSLWKLATLLKSISLEDALDVSATLKDLVVRGLIQLTSFAKLDFPSALKRAYEGRLTFFDASYIVAAKNTGAILVTEDEELLKAAFRVVKTITYTDLENRLSRT